MTKYGEVSGLPTASEGISVFKGVPFAAPPVGELRWKAPQPPAKWEGVRNCDQYAPGAVQSKPAVPFYIDEFPIDYSKVTFSEDCLYLNIWTPAKTGADKLPVMLWIYGGGNEVGFTSEPEFDGEFLAQRGVIYISAAYRLNVFGFLAHPELTAESGYGASGNYGNLDNLAALKWINENITAFGGDPENVTIFGQSAGAMNVNTLAVCPFAKGFFNRAISMSGGGASSTMGSMTLAEAEKLGLEYQAAAGCSSLKELRALPAEKAFQAMKAIGPKARGFSNIGDGYMLPGVFSDLVRHKKHHDITYTDRQPARTRAAAFGEGYKSSSASFNGMVTRMFGGHGDAAREFYKVESDADACRLHTRCDDGRLDIRCQPLGQSAAQARYEADLPLSLRPQYTGQRWQALERGGVPLGRPLVCARHDRSLLARDERGRPQGFRTDDGLLDELCPHRQSQRRGSAVLETLHR